MTTEPTPERLAEAQVEVANGIRNGQVERKRGKGYLLVGSAVLVGLLFLVILLVRSYTTESRDTKLCEKIDRFIVVAEKAAAVDPDRTQAEKDAAIKFYEDFRNDPPVCRTAPAVRVPTTTAP